MSRQPCAHCGLPVLAADGADPRRIFCCYGCSLASRIVGGGPDSVRTWALLRLGVGAFLAMNVMMISLLLYTGALESQAVPLFRWAMLALSTPAMAVLGYPFLLGALEEIRRKRLSLDALIALGSFTAFAVSAVNTARGLGHVYFDTATMLPALVTFGKLIEATAKTRAGRLVHSLETLLPTSAIRLTPDGSQEVPIDRLCPGDHLQIRPGERLPADGIILEGTSTVQEAPFTGEPWPRVCAPGDSVLAGTVNGDGSLVVRIATAGEDMLLRRIIRMVEQARQQPSRSQRIAERMAAVFIPAVLVLAAAAGLLWLWADGSRQAGYVVLAILVVACPCAMGLAAPLATALAMSTAAKAGAIVRGGDVLERIGQLKVILFDKTGTLTLGKAQVQAVQMRGEGDPAGLGSPEVADPDDLLSWLAGLETASEHPLAAAVVAHARAKGLPVGQPHDVTIVPGAGIRGRVTCGGQTRHVVAGTQSFVSPTCLWPGRADQDESAGEFKAIYVGWDGRLQGQVSLSDVIRPGAKESIARLQALSVQTVLLSGDEDATSLRTARQLGIPVVHARRRPDDKIQTVLAAASNGQPVGMVGDGINDAPALAWADVGFAMGGGTDLTRQAGGVVLLSDRLSQIPWLVALSRRTRRIVRQNLLWALGYNAMALTAAAAGVLHPLLAAVAMVVSSLTVLSNSLRLQAFPADLEPAAPTDPQAESLPLSTSSGCTAAGRADAPAAQSAPVTASVPRP